MANNNKTVVIKTDQGNNGIRSKSIPKARKLPKVLIKFTAPNSEDTPARCKEKIAKSTEAPLCATLLLSGG